MVQTHLKSRIIQKNTLPQVEESPSESTLVENAPPKAFLAPDFYDPLINILGRQKACELDELVMGDVGILWDTWKTPYNVDGKTVEEESIEIILGKVTNNNPLKLMNTVTLNSYHGSITYSAGSTTWSHGSLSTTKNITVIEGEFLHRLKLELNTKDWGNDTSYDPKRITKFVRSIENYFNGQFAGKNYQILHRKDLVTGLGPKGRSKIIEIDILAPEIAKETEPGQFVVLRLHERGERIPLTIADFDREEGSIKLIYQTAGKTTEELATLNAGDYILDLLGPLGNNLKIHKYDKPVICVSGGVGLASIYAKTKALKEAGNYVISIVGARSHEQLVLEDEIRAVSDEMYITTDDGLYIENKDGSEAFHRVKADGTKQYGGYVSNVLEALLGQTTFLDLQSSKTDDPNKKNVTYGPSSMVGKYSKHDIAEIVAVGPILMMKSIVNVASDKVSYIPEKDYIPNEVKTMVNLNPIMVDGTGMCGGCRVGIYDPEKKDYTIKFACIDGPIFDGHLVNFQSLFRRSSQYAPKEELSEKVLEVLGW
jgi:ferredoxin--NADP+ reductase